MTAPFNIKELASILEMLQKHDVSEFKLERGGEKIFLKRGVEAPRSKRVTTRVSSVLAVPSTTNLSQGNLSQGMASNVVPLVAGGQQDAVLASRSNQVLREEVLTGEGNTSAVYAVDSSAKKSFKEITSPMVGTFYRRPAVDAAPYVERGDIVKKGDVICIVEAMKLMNEIEADVSGRVTEICLEDGQMVEYGEVLFRIEPS